jgi:hypothetical protein
MTHFTSLRRRLAVILCLGSLAACDTTPPPPVFPDLRFSDRPPINLAVSSIEFRTTFQPQFHPPFVEHLFPESPQRAIDTWARDRLHAVGGNGVARFTLLDADVTETELPRTGGLKGEFTTQAAERYDATVSGRLDILNERGFPARTATATVKRSQTVLEGVTPNERDQVWYDMTRTLARDFDQQMDAQIRENFGTYLR